MGTELFKGEVGKPGLLNHDCKRMSVPPGQLVQEEREAHEETSSLPSSSACSREFRPCTEVFTLGRVHSGKFQGKYDNEEEEENGYGERGTEGL